MYSVNEPGLAAKIYHKPLDDKKTQKLLSMVKMKNQKLLNISAWPVDTLYNSPEGPVVGILMPMVSGFKEIHKLYNPKSRIVEFPNAAWDFLIHISANLARAFSTVHGQGHVIGDINHGNITVSSRGTVMLIDCDSFQINVDGHKYSCGVGIPIYQPPETQDFKSFLEIEKTCNHDNFGLAVIIFQLLFMGRHPFSEKYIGEDDMPLERAIKEGRYAYDRSLSLKSPFGTLSMDEIPHSLARLFKAAFLTTNRPLAGEWVIALESLLKELKQCTINPSHRFYNKLSECPWCRIEKKTGAVLFSPAAGFPGNGGVDIEEIWRNIEEVTVSLLPSLPDWKSISREPSGQYKVYSIKKKACRILSIILSLCGLIGFMLPNMVTFTIISFGASLLTAIAGLIPAPQSIVSKVKIRYNTALEKLNSSISLWKDDDMEKQVLDKKNQLATIYETYRNLEASREKSLKDLQNNKGNYQLERFLSKYSLLDINIKNMPSGLRSVLQSYGIKTAADVQGNISSISGIKPWAVEGLLKWRKSLEEKFVFDPGKGIDREMIKKIDQDFINEKNKIGRVLTEGLYELKKLSDTSKERRKEIFLEIGKYSVELVKARANLKALRYKDISY